MEQSKVRETTDSKIPSIDPLQEEENRKLRKVKSDILEILRNAEISPYTIGNLLKEVRWDIKYNSIYK